MVEQERVAQPRRPAPARPEEVPPPVHQSLAALADLATDLLDLSGAWVVTGTPDEPHPVASSGVVDTTAAVAVPLVSPRGATIGRLCLVPRRPPADPDREQALVGLLAARATDLLEAEAGAAEVERLEVELATVTEDLRRSQEHLTLFAGQVSHDLRSPLTAMLANAEMLAAEPEVAASPDLGWMVDAVRRAAARMNTMIEEMLTYAEQGGRPTLAPTDLGAVCAHVLEDLSPLVESTGAKVEVGALPTVVADDDQVYAVLLNLLTNALRFTPPGEPPRVRVGSRRRDGYWRVSVEDRGIGVPPERQDAMFVLYARADKRVEGSGIGLAVVKRLVEAHGGRVGMESEPGHGTTVWFELPA